MASDRAVERPKLSDPAEWVVERNQRKRMKDKMSNAEQSPGSLERLVVPPGCACVNHDAVDCARIRDGFDTDDPRYDHRRCECGCHSRADDEDDDY